MRKIVPSILDKRWMALAVSMTITFALQLGVNDRVRGQEVTPLSPTREAEIEEARKLTIEVVKLINQGAYDEALPKAARALEIRERVFGSKDPKVAFALGNVAFISYHKNNYAKARELYERALTILEESGLENQDVASVLNNFGILCYAEGDQVRAEQFYRRALAMLSKTPEELENPATADIMTNLALVLAEKKDYKGAADLLRRALAIDEKRFGTDDFKLVSILTNLALLYQSLDDLNMAEQSYQRALAIFEKLQIKTDPLLATVLEHFSALSNAKGDTARAVDLAGRAAEIEEQQLDLMLANGSEEQKHAYWMTLQRSTMMDVSLHVRDAPNNRSAARLALTTVLRRKGRVLDVMADSMRVLRNRSSRADRDLLDQLSVVRSQLAALISQSPESAGDSNNPALAAKLEEYQRLEARMSSSSAELRTQSHPVTIESIQKQIPNDGALVEFVCYKPFNAKTRKVEEQWDTRHFVAYILHHSGEVTWADLGEAQTIDYSVWNLRVALRNPYSNPDGKNITALAHELYEKVMRPVREKLPANTRHLFISPDSTLQLIPFEALMDQHGHYLIEKYSFTYLSSARDLMRLQFRAPSREPPLIIANPDFNQTKTEAKTSPPETAGLSPQPAAPTGTTYAPLTGTEEEAKQIAKLFPDARILKGPAATEAALKQVHGPIILHIGTHGFFPKTVPWGTTNLDITKIDGEEVFKPSIANLLLEANRTKSGAEDIYSLSQSGIVLAGANNHDKADGDDGLLTAFEVGGLDLWGTKLVVLSACETGMGDVETGNGVDGLRRSLLLAGAESQVISFWKVDDEATRDIMIKFYTKLHAGMGRSEALRQVKLGLLRSKNYGHPYYWAAFIGSGDWRSFEGK